MRLLIATQNRGKVREFREILGHDGVEWDDLTAHQGIPVAEESGRTFLANACQKAAFYARLLNIHVVADDSGIELDALGGRPGVYSARWAELHHAGKGDADNNALLLRQIDRVPNPQRTARFVCALALADSDGRIILTARDTVEGLILREPRGSNGFGYDPLFYVAPFGCTMAQLSGEQKHSISHRGQALRRLRGLFPRAYPNRQIPG